MRQYYFPVTSSSGATTTTTMRGPRCSISVTCLSMMLLCFGTAYVAFMVHMTEVKWGAHMLLTDFKMQHQQEYEKSTFIIGPPAAASSLLPKKRVGKTTSSIVAIDACLNKNLVIAETSFAFVSMLSDHFDEYGLAAAKLGASLRQHSRLDLILLEVEGRPIPPAVVETHLAGTWKICTVSEIGGPQHVAKDANRFLQASIYSKLNAWQLTEYEAVVLLDLDILAWRNPSDLFTVHLQAMRFAGKRVGAVRDRPLEDGTCSYALGMKKAVSEFNAGVLLFQPEWLTFQEMKESIHLLPHRSEVDAEQSFFNEFFKNRFYELPIVYNAFTVLKLCEPATWWQYRDIAGCRVKRCGQRRRKR